MNYVLQRTDCKQDAIYIPLQKELAKMVKRLQTSVFGTLQITRILNEHNLLKYLTTK